LETGRLFLEPVPGAFRAMPARGHWLSSLYRDATISHEALVLQISRLTILAGFQHPGRFVLLYVVG